MLQIEQLYLRYKPDVYRYLLRLTRDASLSEELLSETFLAALLALPGYRGDSSVKTWLFGIARNRWLRQLRRRGRETELPEILPEDPSLGPEERAMTREAAGRLKELLAGQDERSRHILLMREEGASFRQIAGTLGISESSARVIEFRTKKRLQAALKEEGLL